MTQYSSKQLFLSHGVDYLSLASRSQQKGYETTIKHMIEGWISAYKYVQQTIEETPLQPFLSSGSKLSWVHLLQSDYVPSHIQQHVSLYTEHLVSYDISIEGHRISIHYLVEDVLTKDAFDAMTAHIMHIIAFLLPYKSKSCANDIDIVLFPSSFKKTMPKDRVEVLDTHHVNSAVTQVCNGAKNQIFIYRREECMKVLIHELFHAFGLDFSIIQETHTQKKFNDIYGIRCDYRMYETYSETWATIIHTIGKVYGMRDAWETDTSKSPTMDDLYHTFVAMMSAEVAFSVFQMNKMLDHMHLNYSLLTERKHEMRQLRRIAYREQSNVFAYYIAKMAVLIQQVDFLGWCTTHNDNLLQFRNTFENVDLFCDFVIRVMQDGDTKVVAQKILDAIDKDVEDGTNGMDETTKKTARMTLFDMMEN